MTLNEADTPLNRPDVAPPAPADITTKPPRKTGRVVTLSLVILLILGIGVAVGAKLLNSNDNTAEVSESGSTANSISASDPRTIDQIESSLASSLRTQIDLMLSADHNVDLASDWASVSAQALTTRLKTFALPGEVHIAGPDRLIVVLAGAVDTATINELIAPGLLELRAVLDINQPEPFEVDIHDESLSDDSTAEFGELDCTNPQNYQTRRETAPHKPIVSCHSDGSAKYLLGPTEITGARILSAKSHEITDISDLNRGVWAVNVVFNNVDAAAVADMTGRLAESAAEGNFAMMALVHDGVVLTAPTIAAPINDGHIEIQGNLTEHKADQLVNTIIAGNLLSNVQIQSVRVLDLE